MSTQEPPPQASCYLSAYPFEMSLRFAPLAVKLVCIHWFLDLVLNVNKIYKLTKKTHNEIFTIGAGI